MYRIIVLTLSLASATISNSTLAADNLKAFPPAGEGQTRHVLHLPKLDDESSTKVELIVGKTVETDGVNRYFFGGSIQDVNIEGWGFTRYVVEDLGPLASSRIGVPPGTPKEFRFVSLAGDPYLFRYNSKLPVVVYVPAGAEVRYRIWSANDTPTPVEEG